VPDATAADTAKAKKERQDAANERLADAKQDAETYSLEALTEVVRDANTNADQKLRAAELLLEHSRA
jgi:hypothetical protein